MANIQIQVICSFLTNLVLGRISNEPLGVGEGYIGGVMRLPDEKHGNVISKLGINIQTNLSMLENSDTGVGGAKVDTNSALLCHFSKLLRARSAILKC